jgi:16S rRNA (adenine1518-N6/adenine1519-N6)-dimethyltransferase
MTLMLQKEVVDRIISAPGGGEYGYLSVLVQFYTEAAKLFEVPPQAFKPQPKVQSAVLRLRLRDRPAVEVADEAEFLELVGAAFAQRRKTILNCLAAVKDSGSKKEIEEILGRAEIDPRRRGETLSLAEFAALDNEWRKRERRAVS